MEKRIDWIDFAKGFTILFVVLGHSIFYMNGNAGIFYHFINLICTFIFTFIMPVFFAISGYLYKRINYIKQLICLIYKKTTSFIIPYLLFSFITYYCDPHRQYGFILDIYKFPLGYTWFLYALLLSFIIFGIMDCLHFNNFVITVVVSILYAFTFILKEPSSPQFSGIIVTFMFLPFFWLGQLMREKYIDVNKIFKNNYILIISFILFLILEMFYKIYFNIGGITSNITSVNIIPKIIITMILFYIFNLIKKNKIIDILGKNSLIIYLIHFPIIRLMSTFLIGKNYIFWWTIYFCSSLLVSFVFIKLCRYSLVKGIFYPRQWIDPLVKKTRFGKWIFS